MHGFKEYCESALIRFHVLISIHVEQIDLLDGECLTRVPRV